MVVYVSAFYSRLFAALAQCEDINKLKLKSMCSKNQLKTSACRHPS
jgi:hypothetical protein